MSKTPYIVSALAAAVAIYFLQALPRIAEDQDTDEIQIGSIPPASTSIDNVVEEMVEMDGGVADGGVNTFREDTDEPSDSPIEPIDPITTTFRSKLESVLGRQMSKYSMYNVRRTGDFYFTEVADSVEVSEILDSREQWYTDRKILTITRNEDGTYMVATGATFVGDSINKYSNRPEPYASMNGDKSTVEDSLAEIIEWQEGYELLHGTMREPGERISQIAAMRQAAQRLTDSTRYSHIAIDSQAREVLAETVKTYEQLLSEE